MLNSLPASVVAVECTSQGMAEKLDETNALMILPGEQFSSSPSGTNSWQNPKACQLVDSDVFSSSRRTSAESGIDSSCNEESSALGSRRGFAQRTKQGIRSTCTMKLLKRRFPPLQWLPSYSLHYLLFDFLAGLTVALTSIPQSIAYAAVAGLPLEYGLYNAFAGPLAYALFGSVKEITEAPTAVIAIMVQSYAVNYGPEYVIVLSFLSGCFELIAGLLNLGFLMDFISGPVISGFCSAAAITVVFSQLKAILGLKFKGSSFIKVLPSLFTNYQDILLWDAILGFSMIAFLILLKNITSLKSCFSNSCCLHNSIVNKTIWLISTFRNAIAVLIGCIMTYVLDLYGYQPFTLTGDIKAGIPSFQLPPFNFERLVESSPMAIVNSSSNWTDIVANQTYEFVSFTTIVSDLGTGLILVPVIAILEQVAIAKAFSNGCKTDSTQEMIAVGIGSIFCSFFGSMPSTASFSRSSVLSASGGKTQLASAFNGAVVLLALAFLMPTFYFIPKAVLGAVIITAVYPMIEYHEIMPMWRGRRIELIPFMTTFLCCLLYSIEIGILIGAQVHLLLLAYESSRSKSTTMRYREGNEERLVLTMDRNLYFPSVERFRNALTRVSLFNAAPNRTIVIDMSRITQIDHTSLKMLKSMLSIWDKREEKYSFINVSREVRRVLKSVLPATIAISRSTLSSEDTKVSFDGGSEGSGSSVGIKMDYP